MTESQPHVVAVVGNDIISDSRVKKIAASAAAAGFRSTIVCYTPEAEESISKMGAVDVIRIPVPFSAKNMPGRVAQPLRPFSGLELASRHSGPRTIQMARRRRLESNGDTTRLRLLKARIFIRRSAFKIRRRLHVTIDRVIRRVNLARRRISMRALGPLRNPVANVYDYEVTFGPVLESLEPDVIHAHDFHMIGVAVTAARRLRKRGHQTKVVYDAHELVEGLSYPKRVIQGWLAEEAEFIHAADAVTGVSPEQVVRIAKKYQLEELPTVVLNAPLRGDTGKRDTSLRRGIPPSAKILAYHGNIAEERGVFTLVDALPHLEEDVHVVLIAPTEHPLARELEAHAERIGVSHRVHMRPFVPTERLEAYLREADVGVIPYLHTGNNDIALPNKLFEALQSELPIVASDMRALTRFIEEHHVGKVFRHGDAVDLAKAVGSVLDDPGAYRSRITTELRESVSWNAQGRKLVGVYERVLGRKAPSPVIVTAEDTRESLPRKWIGLTTRRVAIGPRNMAGQAYLLARAVEDHLDIEAESFSLRDGSFDFAADHQIAPEMWREPSWQIQQRRLLSSRFTHVIAESGSGILGTMNGGFIDEQLPVLRNDGIEVAVLLHGSEIRDPERHRRRPHSPYAEHDPLIGRLVKNVDKLRRHLADLDIPVFVTTPDLLEDVDATWLPVVIDAPYWGDVEPAFTNDKLRVLHSPTNGLLKGSRFVDDALNHLHSIGMVEYVRADRPVPPNDMRRLIESVDVVVDGLVLGAYGVMSCQTMAAGRIAVANVDDLGVLEADCPVVHATPEDIGQRIRSLAESPREWKSIADAGRSYVIKYHDGAFSAGVLAPFLSEDVHR